MENVLIVQLNYITVYSVLKGYQRQFRWDSKENLMKGGVGRVKGANKE